MRASAWSTDAPVAVDVMSNCAALSTVKIDIRTPLRKAVSLRLGGRGGDATLGWSRRFEVIAEHRTCHPRPVASKPLLSRGRRLIAFLECVVTKQSNA